jgi:SAM-dependent methyltransferase
MSTAPGWEKWAEWNETQHAEVIDWLVDPLEAHMTLLDLASGVGQPALAAARRVKRVIATDVAADMLAALERRVRAAGITNVELRELDMHELRGVGDRSVGAVTLAFGLMFSRDPAAVLREARRVLVPGGTLSVVVWDEPARNPFFTTMFGSVAEVVPMPAPAPGAPGPFALAAPGLLEQLVRESGFATVTVEAKPFQFEFDSLDHHWQINTALAAPLQRAVEALPAERVQDLRAAFARNLAPYRDGDRVRITATPLCARAA